MGKRSNKHKLSVLTTFDKPVTEQEARQMLKELLGGKTFGELTVHNAMQDKENARLRQILRRADSYLVTAQHMPELAVDAVKEARNLLRKGICKWN